MRLSRAISFRLLLFSIGASLVAGCSGEGSSSDVITVFCAASAGDVMSQAAERFESETGVRVRINAAGSSTLARQILAGAEADVFVSADEAWMDYLERSGLIVDGSRFDLLGNALVMIAPVDAAAPDDRWYLNAAMVVDRVAIADPTHVPAGRYAKEALESLGQWDAVHARVIPALDVRAALRLVELGEADVGIVYRTDALGSDVVEIVGTYPAGVHAPIRYPAAIVRKSAGSEEFLVFLRSDAARAIFEDAGFEVIADSRGVTP